MNSKTTLWVYRKRRSNSSRRPNRKERESKAAPRKDNLFNDAKEEEDRYMQGRSLDRAGVHEPSSRSGSRWTVELLIWAGDGVVEFLCEVGDR